MNWEPFIVNCVNQSARIPEYMHEGCQLQRVVLGQF